MTDDDELLRRFLDDASQPAFAELVRKYVDLVYTSALRRTGGRSQLAEEVTQVVFVALARHAHALRHHPALAAWLHTATRNAASNLIRAERRRLLRENDAARANAIEMTATTDDAWQKLGPLLDEAMDELSERDRLAIILRFFKQRSYSDIGEIDGPSEDAARVRVNRALEKLRQVLARRGLSSTSAFLSATLSAQPIESAPTSLIATLIQTDWLVTAVPSSTAWLTLMNAKITATVATALAVLAVGVAWYQTAELHQARQLLRALAAEQRPPSASVAAPVETLLAPTSPSTPPENNPERPAENSESTASVREVATPNPVRQLSTTNPLRTLWSLRGDATAMQAWLDAQPAELDLQLGPAFQALHLSAQDSARLRAILMEKFQTVADIANSAQRQGVAASDPSVRGLLRDATEKAETSIHALLGDTAYQQLREFGETQPVREIVKTLAGEVYYSSTPLTSVQGEQLVTLIAQQSPRGESGANPTAANWTRIFDAAAGVLTPTQLVALRGQITRIQLQQRLNQSGTGAARSP